MTGAVKQHFTAMHIKHDVRATENDTICKTLISN